jgi:hypothetical protein
MRFVFLVCLIFVSTFQTLSAANYGDFTYEQITLGGGGSAPSESYIQITKYNGSATSVSFPSSINGLPVKVLGSGVALFNVENTVTSLTIPSTVTYIGDGACSSCTGLTSITIPNSVTSIGVRAFSDCIQLKQVTMSSNLTNLGGAAFYGCSNLTDITIPTKLLVLEDSVFESTGLTSITVPDNIQSIRLLAFARCLSLEKVYLGNGVSVIGVGAFVGCLNLKTIVFGQNVNIIGDGIVYNCSNLESIYFLGNAPLSPAYQTGYPETTKAYYNPAKTGWNNQWVTAYAGGRSVLPFLPKIKSQGISIDQEIKKYSISFNTVYGVRYDIETSSDLVNWSTIQTINGDGNENTFLTDMTDKAFFRIFQQ